LITGDIDKDRVFTQKRSRDQDPTNRMTQTPPENKKTKFFNYKEQD